MFKIPCTIDDVLTIGYASKWCKMHPVCVQGSRIGLEAW